MSHREFCERFIASMSVGDFDALAVMLDEDFVVHEAHGLPYAGDYHGIAGWRALSQAVVSTWGSFRLKPLEFLGETADTFVVRFAISGRSRKTALGSAMESSPAGSPRPTCRNTASSTMRVTSIRRRSLLWRCGYRSRDSCGRSK